MEQIYTTKLNSLRSEMIGIITRGVGYLLEMEISNITRQQVWEQIGGEISQRVIEQIRDYIKTSYEI